MKKQSYRMKDIANMQEDKIELPFFLGEKATLLDVIDVVNALISKNKMIGNRFEIIDTMDQLGLKLTIEELRVRGYEVIKTEDLKKEIEKQTGKKIK